MQRILNYIQYPTDELGCRGSFGDKFVTVTVQSGSAGVSSPVLLQIPAFKLQIQSKH